MHRAVLCLLVLAGAVTCNAPSMGKNKDHKVGGKSGQGSGAILKSNVKYISGNDPSCDEPVEYFFINKNNELNHQDQGNDSPVHIADDAVLAETGWDTSLWYLDTEGQVFRLDFNKTDPAPVPNVPEGVKFNNLAIVLYGDAWAITEDGSVYHYIANTWFKLDNSPSSSLSDISVGIDGVLLLSDEKNGQVWQYNYGTQNWDVYEKQGLSAELFDVDHVVVVKDKDNNVATKVMGKWSDIKEKCADVTCYGTKAFYCLTANGDVKRINF